MIKTFFKKEGPIILAFTLWLIIIVISTTQLLHLFTSL